MTTDRNHRHLSPLFWPVPFGAWRNLPTGWHWFPRWVLGEGEGTDRAWHYNRHPDPQPPSLEPDDADLGGAAPPAPVGRVGGLGGVAAAGASDGDDHSGQGSAAGGEWPEGCLGVAMRVGSERYNGAGYPWAHVATQHHGVQRVRLRAPVERLALVFAWDLVGCEDMAPGMAAEGSE